MTDGTAAIGTIHFALIALLAALVVVGIVWGVRNKRRQVQGEKEFEAHAEEAGVELDHPEPDAPLPTPAPAPSPPSPLADQPAPGTPAESDKAPQPRPLVGATPPAVPSDETTVALVVDPATANSPALADAPLTRIKGLGPKVAARMAELGIDRVGQLAALDDKGIHDLDAQMGAFTGRIMRDRWIEQARLLAAGDREGFERAFGRLG